MTPFADLYAAGRHVEAWERLSQACAAKPSLADGEDADRLARLTFERVARNIDRIIAGLRRVGYRFECENPELGQATPPRRLATPEALSRIAEAAWPGRWPLALRGFTRFVGDVDLRQSFADSAHEAPDPVLAWLGDWDPLVFDSGYLCYLLDEVADDPEHPRREGRFVAVDLAPDLFHKADVSGADGYVVRLPDTSPDPSIEPGTSNFLNYEAVSFLTYLRRCLSRGGFYGAPSLIYDRGHGWLGTDQVSPGLYLLNHSVFADLAAGLELF